MGGGSEGSKGRQGYGNGRKGQEVVSGVQRPVVQCVTWRGYQVTGGGPQG